MKHKHYDLIVAWAEGAEIQRLEIWQNVSEWVDTRKPAWSDTTSYRIKPKPPITVYGRLCKTNESACIAGGLMRQVGLEDDCNFSATFDGNNGQLLSVEMLK